MKTFGPRCRSMGGENEEAKSSGLLPLHNFRETQSVIASVLRAAALVLTTILGLAFSTSILSAPRAASDRKADRPTLIFVQAPVVRSGILSERFPKGSRIVRLDGKSKAPTVLTQGFFAAADPQISFDANKVLFAGQKVRDAHWQIWEMDTDGSGKRQITNCSGDCVEPAYLPRGEIVYTAILSEASQRVSQVFVSKMDGSEARQITFGPGDYQVETVLENGRILISANSPLLQTRRASSRLFYTLRSDGTGLAAFRCEHGQPFLRSQAVELDDGSLVFVKKKPAESRLAGGELAEIARGALHNSLIAPPRLSVYSPRQLGPDELIVARPTATPRGGQEKLDLYSFSPTHRQFGELIYRDPKLSSIAAVPVAAHEPPRWYWSTLDPKRKAGFFICIDSYRSSAAPKGADGGAVLRRARYAS